MSRMPPLHIIILGFILVVLGFLLPFLMILHIIESSFLLNFLAYGASVAGLMLGIMGAASYVRRNKRRG
jgi:membrane protein implicated in regulation of membrane protease activity